MELIAARARAGSPSCRWYLAFLDRCSTVCGASVVCFRGGRGASECTSRFQSPVTNSFSLVWRPLLLIVSRGPFTYCVIRAQMKRRLVALYTSVDSAPCSRVSSCMLVMMASVMRLPYFCVYSDILVCRPRWYGDVWKSSGVYSDAWLVMLVVMMGVPVFASSVMVGC